MANYFVSATGNDSNAGTSTGAPWLTLTKASTATLTSDDTLSLKRGDSFAGTLSFSAQTGTSGHPFVIGAYGSGAKPIISCGNQRAVYLQNCSYATVQDIRAEGIGVIAATGLMADGSTNFLYAFDVESTLSVGSLLGIRVLRCQATGVFGGVYVHCEAATTPIGFNGVEIGGDPGDPYLCYEALGLGVNVYGSIAANNSGSPYFLAKGRAQHSNVWVHDFNIYNVYAVPSAVYTLNNYTGSPVVVSNTTTGLIEYGIAHTSGHKNDDGRGGPVGIMTIETDSVVIQNAEIYDMRTSGADGTGIDMDGGTINGIVQRCYCHNNHHSPFATGSFPGSSTTDTNTFRFNISENNGGTSAVHTFGTGSNTTIERNTFYHVPTGDYSVLHGYGAGWTYRNNIALTTGVKTLGHCTNGGGGSDVFQGNLYFSLSATPNWTDDTHTNSGANAFTTIAAFRTSTNLVIPPETQASLPVGSYQTPALPSVGAGGTVGSVRSMNALFLAYDPSAGGVVNTAGIAGGTSANDFHGNAPLSGTAVGAVEYHVAVSGGISRNRMQLGM